MEENQAPAPTVMSVSVKWGAIMAAVSITIFVVKIALGSNPFESDWSNWAGIVIAIGLIVMAQNNFKNDGDGYMSYGQGFGIGTLSMLVSGIIGMLFSMIYINFIDTGVMDDFYRITEENMREQGQTDDQIDVAIEWTKKLFWPMYIFMMVLFSVLCGLIVTIFTQKKKPEAI